MPDHNQGEVERETPHHDAMKSTAITEFKVKSLGQPDEEAAFPGATMESVRLGALTVTRMIFQPGWRWTDNLPSIIGTDTCEYPHPAWMVLSSRFTVRMNDGMEKEFGPGDIGMIPQGHDTWVVGNEPVTAIDIQVNGAQV